MPRNVRGVNRGVQDAEEIRKYREEERRKKAKKAKTWCSMVGLTVLEFLLCIICFAFAYVYYHYVQQYRNNNMIHHNRKTTRYILLPPAPLAIASVFLSLTYLDLISWKSIRPITYFAWIMVASAGFLCFFLYAGVILMTNTSVPSIFAIIFGLITGLVFLGDLICMLVSMKRFPAPYWVLKRKFDKMDQCVCTGDILIEQAGLREAKERPICRCGDHWGAPCSCDDPDVTCGCGADKSGKAPCECCECAAQDLVEEDFDYAYEPPQPKHQSIALSTCASTRDSHRRSTAERQKSIASEAYFDSFESTPVHDYCSQSIPGMYCIDVHKDSGCHSKQQEIVRQLSMPQGSQTRTESQIAVARSLQSPSHRLSARRSNRSMSVDSRQHPSRAISMGSRNRSQLAYSVYTTSVDNKDLINKKEPVYFYENEDVKKVFDKLSSDEEIGEGDIPKKKIASAYNNNMPTHKKKIKPRMKHTASNYIGLIEPDQTITLPGQALDTEDSQLLPRRRNVSVSAIERKRSCSIQSETETRPKSTRIIRNVSTTVRAIKTLSKVMEADNESRSQQSSDGIPSECTITINKYPAEHCDCCRCIQIPQKPYEDDALLDRYNPCVFHHYYQIPCGTCGKTHFQQSTSVIGTLPEMSYYSTSSKPSECRPQHCHTTSVNAGRRSGFRRNGLNEDDEIDLRPKHFALQTCQDTGVGDCPVCLDKNLCHQDKCQLCCEVNICGPNFKNCPFGMAVETQTDNCDCTGNSCNCCEFTGLECRCINKSCNNGQNCLIVNDQSLCPFTQTECRCIDKTCNDAQSCVILEEEEEDNEIWDNYLLPSPANKSHTSYQSQGPSFRNTSTQNYSSPTTQDYTSKVSFSNASTSPNFNVQDQQQITYRTGPASVTNNTSRSYNFSIPDDQYGNYDNVATEELVNRGASLQTPVHKVQWSVNRDQGKEESKSTENLSGNDTDHYSIILEEEDEIAEALYYDKLPCATKVNKIRLKLQESGATFTIQNSKECIESNKGSKQFGSMNNSNKKSNIVISSPKSSAIKPKPIIEKGGKTPKSKFGSKKPATPGCQKPITCNAKPLK